MASDQKQPSCSDTPTVQAERSAPVIQRQELGSIPQVLDLISRVGNEPASDHKETNEFPLQQAQGGAQGDTCQFSKHLGDSKQNTNAQACRVPNPVNPNLTGNQSARATAGSACQAARSTARVGSPVLGDGGRNETQGSVAQGGLSLQNRDVVYRELVCPEFQNGYETKHQWVFGAVAELLDNAVDEIPHGASKVLIDCIPNPRDGSPSLLVQDDGGGMDPDSLCRCLTTASPKRKPPNAIGQNGTGFRAGISRLGTSAIVFSRCVNTSEPTQSIGLMLYVPRDDAWQKHLVIPMVHYKYDPRTSGITSNEREPWQFGINMSMLLKLSPYNSEEELLRNFSDIGPHGTKVIVFNLSCNDRGDLELDFDTDNKDIGISTATVLARTKAVGDQNHLVCQYTMSLRTYISILYLGLPRHFRIILRGEEVKRRNLATELKHSQRMTYRRSSTAEEYEMVLGFLDGAPDGLDRFCFYHKRRLILPFLPALGHLDKNQGIVAILEPNFLEPAKTKQDFQWSKELDGLLKTLKEMRTEFWNNLKTKELKKVASCLSLAPPSSYNGSNLTAATATVMRSQMMTPSAQAHLPAPILESSYGVIPDCPAPPPFWSEYGGGASSHGIPPRAPAPHLPAFSMASVTEYRHWLTMPAVTSIDGSGGGMDVNGSAASGARPAYNPPPFSQPGGNGVMRAPATHDAMAAIPDLPIKMEHDAPAPSAAAPTPAVIDNGEVHDSSSSSRQKQELESGSDQEERGAKVLPGKPVVTVERESE